MKETSFKLILEGPPGSGKCSFINELLHLYKAKPSWQERYIFTEIEDHKLLVQVFMPAIPKEIENGI